MLMLWQDQGYTTNVCVQSRTSALGMVSAAVALVTVEVRCMTRRCLVSPTSRTSSPRLRDGCGSSSAARTCSVGRWLGWTHIGQSNISHLLIARMLSIAW